jgi:hypothetical protein
MATSASCHGGIGMLTQQFARCYSRVLLHTSGRVACHWEGLQTSDEHHNNNNRHHNPKQMKGLNGRTTHIETKSFRSILPLMKMVKENNYFWKMSRRTSGMFREHRQHATPCRLDHHHATLVHGNATVGTTHIGSGGDDAWPSTTAASWSTRSSGKSTLTSRRTAAISVLLHPSTWWKQWNGVFET